MRPLSTHLRRQLETAVVEGRRAAETGVRAALESLGVAQDDKPSHLNEVQARLRRGLRAKQRQLGGEFEVLVWDAAYEQWHRLLFARFLAENELLRHPQYGVTVTLADCEELANELEEPDGWSVAALFAAEILPGIFRLEDPCVQLRLAPEHRVALERIVAGLPAEVFTADDSLGWVYQYWQSERKEQVNASEVKIGGADLGPVTQLFTENYMVRFLLENSLGAWWAARHADSPLVKEFEYLRFGEDGRPAAGSFEGWPEAVAEVTVMDPCCGSGHFLVEGFTMLWRMRAEEESLDPIAAQDAVLTENLFGLELDPRCVQIATLAVALAAWKQGGGWRELPTPNIACSGIPAKAPLKEWTALADGDERLEFALERLHTLFTNADTLGSLIDPKRAAERGNAAGLQRSFEDVDFHEIALLLEKAAVREAEDPAIGVLGADAAGIARAAALLSRSYTLIATNPPYLGRGHQAHVLREHSLDNHPASEAQLGNVMAERWRVGEVSALVLPQGWLFMSTFSSLRDVELKWRRWHALAWLGDRAFEAISGEVVKVVLFVASQGRPDPEHSYLEASALEAQGPTEKGNALRVSAVQQVRQVPQLQNPDAVVVTGGALSGPFLSEFAESRAGLGTGDDPSFVRYFWEVPQFGTTWERLQSAPSTSSRISGCQKIILWEEEQGRLAAFAESVKGENTATQGWRRGKPYWGSKGVVVKLMGDLFVAPYYGRLYDRSCGVIRPLDERDLGALWVYARTGGLEKAVRSFHSKLSVETGTLLSAPFDADYWRQRARDEGLDGLPEPWSDDPTQWLFEGRPEVSTEPLQVGVGRLLGYRWPEQPESDDLDELSDDDGIVCLPAVGGELPAADRLTALLGKAYGDRWSPALAHDLLKQAGSKKKTVADWLRGDFFKDHCRMFSDRPFVWHVTDGRNDGFSVLVNYHQLDRAGLEKLIYTYLGGWLEQQRAEAADEVAGADMRLAAAQELKGMLERILEGEQPYDIYVRWKPLDEQPIGWEPDLDDGVRLNIRPFVNAGVLAGPSSVPRVNWTKDRGRDPDGSERKNDRHPTIAQKQQARRKQ